MIAFSEIEFECPCCGARRKTLITKEKYMKLRGNDLIQNIFNPVYYDAAYREIFVSNMCTKCQNESDIFDPSDKIFDVGINESISSIEHNIEKMYENERT